MSPELLLGLAAILAAVALLIRAFATRTSTDTAKDALLISLAARADEQGKTLQAVLLAQVAGRDREVAAAIREGQKDVKIAQLTAALELENAETITLLKRLESKTDIGVANSSLANQQLTTLQHTVAVNAQPGDTAAADAAHSVNIQKDYNATQGNAPVVMPGAMPPQSPSPVLADGLEVVIAGTLSIDTPVAQEVPPPVPPAPGPIGVVDGESGELRKVS